MKIYTYNQDNLILEINSPTTYQHFYYDDSSKLIKSETALGGGQSSSQPAVDPYAFVNPNETGITYTFYVYNENGNLSRTQNYEPREGQDISGESKSFEYDSNNRISKVLFHERFLGVSYFSTFIYDNNGNVLEEDAYSTGVIDGRGLRHIFKYTFEYDSYVNPFAVLKHTGSSPGINSNPNNIIKTVTYYYSITPGVVKVYESTIKYQYDYEIGYPIKVINAYQHESGLPLTINGEEYIYD